MRELILLRTIIRVLLDMLQDEDSSHGQGMREDFICNDSYTEEIFEKVAMMRNFTNLRMHRLFHGS